MKAETNMQETTFVSIIQGDGEDQMKNIQRQLFMEEFMNAVIPILYRK